MTGAPPPSPLTDILSVLQLPMESWPVVEVPARRRVGTLTGAVRTFFYT